MATKEETDYVIAGGGLQGSLIAIAILTKNPDAKVLLVEKSQAIGGHDQPWGHTWCFFKSDIPEDAFPWIQPIIHRQWNQYEVSFPTYQRVVVEPYYMVTSATLNAHVQAVFNKSTNAKIIYGQTVQALEQSHIVLQDGTLIAGKIIIDARGNPIKKETIEEETNAKENPSEKCTLPQGYQKFLGWHVRLKSPHYLKSPVLMDNRVNQLDGFRFLYLLPTSPSELLIEDTYFSLNADLNVQTIEERIVEYSKNKNFVIQEIFRKEKGVLPLPWNNSDSSQSPKRMSPEGVIETGYKGGWFHPITGYSTPCAIRIANLIATSDISDIEEKMKRLRSSHEKQISFFHKLNEVFFLHYEPEHRWNLMARFYMRPKKTIHNFYSLNMRWIDKFITIAGGVPREMQLISKKKKKERSETHPNQ